MGRDNLKLKSGRELYANLGFIAINDALGIAEGYDGGLPYAPCSHSYEFADEDDKLTKEEALELADIMIDRWTRFKEACK